MIQAMLPQQQLSITPPTGFMVDPTASPTHIISPNPSKVTMGIPPINHPSAFYSDAVQLQIKAASSADMDEMVTSNLSRVLLIYTGGTIGMQHTKEMGYIPVPNFLTKNLSSQLRFHDPTDQIARDAVGSTAIAGFPAPAPDKLFNKVIRFKGDEPVRADALITPISLWGKRIVYSVLEYDPLLDSTNMGMEDWVKIASDIELNYDLYDAFIILHGTDTMAYTASALSFMLENLGKTVILTGSQVPLAEVRNDAIENLLGALTIAGHFVIPEVTLYFHNKLYRGNRTSKVNAVEFEAFDSPNMSALVKVGVNINVHWRDMWRPRDLSKFKAHKHLDPNVATLRLFPGITISTIKAFLAPPIRGVVLETYGAGNAPNSRADIMSELKNASQRGVVIVNCTQCRRGLVSSEMYSTGKALMDAGVTPGADMTTECALTKLSYLLGKPELSIETIRLLMNKSIRGELSAVSNNPKFGLTRYDFGSVINQVLGNRIHPQAQQDMSITEFSESTPSSLTFQVERTLAPILVCLAAKQGNPENLEYILSQCPSVSINQLDPLSGATALHHACMYAQYQTVQYLLLNGANLHVLDRIGHTCLWCAVKGQEEINGGALIGLTELDTSRDSIILLLVETGAMLNRDELKAVQYELLIAMNVSSFAEFQMRVQKWIKAGYCIDSLLVIGRNRQTLLHLAADMLNFEMCKFLVDQCGASKAVLDMNGDFAIDLVHRRQLSTPKNGSQARGLPGDAFTNVQSQYELLVQLLT